MDCTLGLGIIYYRYEGHESDAYLTKLLDGHGVGVVEKDMASIHGLDDPWCKEIGVLRLDVQTIVGRSGGASVETGDIIIHTPRFCAQGIEQYSS